MSVQKNADIAASGRNTAGDKSADVQSWHSAVTIAITGNPAAHPIMTPSAVILFWSPGSLSSPKVRCDDDDGIILVGVR